jgi:hypothetical protein
MRGVEWTEGPPNMKRGDGASEGSLQSHSGANPNPKRAKNRGNVPKGGEADGVALTAITVTVIVYYTLKNNVILDNPKGAPYQTNTL